VEKRNACAQPHITFAAGDGRFIGGGGDGSCDGGGCCISGGGGNCGDFVVHRKAVVAFLTIVAVMELRR